MRLRSRWDRVSVNSQPKAVLQGEFIGYLYVGDKTFVINIIYVTDDGDVNLCEGAGTEAKEG